MKYIYNKDVVYFYYVCEMGINSLESVQWDAWRTKVIKRENWKSILYILEEKISIEKSIDDFLSDPKSIPMFEGLFNAIKEELWKKERLTFVDTNTLKKILIHRSKMFYGDTLLISITGGSSNDVSENKIIVLRKEIAHLSKKEAHLSSRESIKNVLQQKFEPCLVEIFDTTNIWEFKKTTNIGELEEMKTFSHKY